MLRNIDDILGKNILRDVFQLRGDAQTEAEVPPGNPKRIDLWFVPDDHKLNGPVWPAGPVFTDILAAMTIEPAALEVWSDALSVQEFHSAMTKRDLWHESLELRDKRPWIRPMLWHVCAGKPETVLGEYGFGATDIRGWYRLPNPGLRVQVVVLGELQNVRGTLLLRLLGRGKVRRDALRELRALPDDAWEKQLAQPWLVRVGLHVPLDRWASPEDREFVMDIQAWYKEHNRQLRDEFRREAEADFEARLAEERRLLEAQFVMDIQAWYKEHNRQLRDEFRREAEADFEARLAEERRQREARLAEERRLFEAQRAEERRQAELAQLARQFEHRLGRRLTADERGVLTSQVDTHGSAHVADLVLDLSGPELAKWLLLDITHPNV